MKTFNSLEVLQIPSERINNAVKSALTCRSLDLPKSEIFKSHNPTQFELELASFIYDNFELI